MFQRVCEFQARLRTENDHVMGDDDHKPGAQLASDEALMMAYVAGDKAAFRVLFERYSPQVLALARRRVSSDDEARDITQQTFLHLHRARNDFRSDAKLRPWLFTIAMNLVREHYRRRGRRREALLEPERMPEPPSDGDPVRQGELQKQVQRALATLPDGQREVIELHWISGIPYEQVAEIVGASEAAVRVRAHRAYAVLRELLKDM